MNLLEVRDLQKSHRGPDGGVLRVLDVPAFDLAEGEQAGLAGASGTGKTTLLHVIAGLVRADAGAVRVAGTEVTALAEPARDAFRARTIGYVFQSFHLLPAFTALENVLLGMSFGPGPDRARARELLERLDLEDRLRHRPRQLSIGQQQRVAIARALANRPRLVLADEPTGNLDPARARSAMALLRDVCRENGASLLCVSHDREALASLDRVVELASINRAALDAGSPA